MIEILEHIGQRLADIGIHYEIKGGATKYLVCSYVIIMVDNGSIYVTINSSNRNVAKYTLCDPRSFDNVIEYIQMIANADFAKIIGRHMEKINGDS